MNEKTRDWSKVQRRKSPYQVNVRLSKGEHDQLVIIAQQHGTSKAGYMKSATFARPIPRASRRPPAVAGDLRQLLGLMGKLGSNANQIARLCNSGTITEARDAQDSLQGIRAELTTMRALLLDALKGAP